MPVQFFPIYQYDPSLSLGEGAGGRGSSILPTLQDLKTITSAFVDKSKYKTHKPATTDHIINSFSGSKPTIRRNSANRQRKSASLCGNLLFPKQRTSAFVDKSKYKTRKPATIDHIINSDSGSKTEINGSITSATNNIILKSLNLSATGMILRILVQTSNYK